MRLDQELVKRGLCESRTEAQELISLGKVFVSGIICTKKIKQVDDGIDIKVESRRQFVGRGGEKLQGIFFDIFKTKEKIKDFCKDKIALDVGSSTGGFTDCLLSYGVSHVDAVDVGTNQLHQKIKNDNRVTFFENTDIRSFKNNKKYNIVVVDISFISLENIIDYLISFGEVGTNYFILIKPQFEVGKGNTKKGIVKNIKLVDSVLIKYKTLAKSKGMHSIEIFPCRITGGDGNQEYFLFSSL